MCGIVAYVGYRPALPVLLAGLRRLEYRGYDSAGVALVRPGWIERHRVAGPLDGLVRATRRVDASATTGIGHTRWATHGAPTVENAHPHIDCHGTWAVLHTGIIETHEALRARLRRRGHRFRSQTDTEVIAHLLEDAPSQDPPKAVAWATARLEGSFSLEIVSARDPGRVVAVRLGSPLVVGLGVGEQFIASDVPALLPFTRRVVYLEDAEQCEVTADGIRLERAGRRRRMRIETLRVGETEAERSGYPHFMLKEIHEQPEAVAAALQGRIDLARAQVRLTEKGYGRIDPRRVRRVVAIGCGTALHAALVAKRSIEGLARVPVDVVAASEFRYGEPVLGPGTVVLAISQSGETADTLAGVRLARASRRPVLAIVNVPGSALTREADAVLPMRAGLEIGVASTKAYTSQLVMALLLALDWGRQRGTLSPSAARALLKGLVSLPGALRRTLGLSGTIRRAAQRFAKGHHGNFMFVGRGYNFATAFEGALKLKEITYRHAEGYGAGEMKHGPLALVDARLPVVAVAVRDTVRAKIASNIEEIRARGGNLLVVGTEGDHALARRAGVFFGIPDLPEPLTPVVAVVPLQLFAYHLAVALGRDVDRPRNLAKSVTVE
ncbi:MAG: glutamine--fructose-6-phosphate transaminase (isomerizing) [Planctomycetes bacterium]|nr:glutamine--fructose-6-phosphate transaminase (isomerizing) [Planctomycetota bacterium]